MMQEDASVRGNPYVVRGLANLFATEEEADCDIVFYPEASSDAPASSDSPARITSKQLTSGWNSSCSSSIYGSPLPAHLFILRLASDRFGAQKDWSEASAVACGGVDSPGGGDRGPAAKRHRGQVQAASAGSAYASSSATGRRVLRVPLGSEAEVPAARAAIKFAYTGSVDVRGIREIFEVRRQGAYLQMKGCAAACDAQLAAMMLEAPAPTRAVPRSRSRRDAILGITVRNGAVISDDEGDTEDGNDDTDDEDEVDDKDRDDEWVELPAVVQLYDCMALWPDPRHEPSFAAVLAIACRSLLSLVSDVKTVLNGSKRLQGWVLRLPASALEVLLADDGLELDSEASALVVLATWMKANYETTDTETRRQLCLSLRLAHLSMPYRSLVLPALAADFEKDPNAPAGWFPLTPMEAAAVSAYAATDRPVVRELLLRPDDPPGWAKALRARSRNRLVLVNFEWTLPQCDLVRALQRAKEAAQVGGGRERLPVRFAGGRDYAAAWGFEWRVFLTFADGGGRWRDALGLQLECSWPSPLLALGSRLAGGGGDGGPRSAVGLVAAAVSVSLASLGSEALGGDVRDGLRWELHRYERVPGMMGSSGPLMPSRGQRLMASGQMRTGDVRGYFSVGLDV